MEKEEEKEEEKELGTYTSQRSRLSSACPLLCIRCHPTQLNSSLHSPDHNVTFPTIADSLHLTVPHTQTLGGVCQE